MNASAPVMMSMMPNAVFATLSLRTHIRLALPPLSVMIGANGTGKTSILDALALLASSAQARLTPALSDLSGLANVLTYDRADELILGISTEVPGHEPLDYLLRLRPQGLAHSIREETLGQQRRGHTEPFLHIHSSEPLPRAARSCCFGLDGRRHDHPYARAQAGFGAVAKRLFDG